MRSSAARARSLGTRVRTASRPSTTSVRSPSASPAGRRAAWPSMAASGRAAIDDAMEPLSLDWSWSQRATCATMDRMPRSLHPDTIAIAAGRPAAIPDGPLSEPVTLASAFHAGGDNGYARDGHPGAAAFEEAIGALEGGHALAFASGMAACSAILDGLPVGATVVAPIGVYMGVRQLLDEAGTRLTTRWVDETDTEATLAATQGADLLWIETPLNPLLEVADLAALARGARRLGVPVAVDATVAGPMLLGALAGQRPRAGAAPRGASRHRARALPGGRRRAQLRGPRRRRTRRRAVPGNSALRLRDELRRRGEHDGAPRPLAAGARRPRGARPRQRRLRARRGPLGRPRASARRQRPFSGSSRCMTKFTRLTMIAPSTPHQNVSISKSGTSQSVR